MNNTTILMYQVNGKEIKLSHACKTEQGIEPEEKFVIVGIIGDFKQLKLRNQYGHEIVINPNQIID